MKRSVTICDYKGCGREVRHSQLGGNDWKKNVGLPGIGSFQIMIRALREEVGHGERAEVDLCDEHRDEVLKLIGSGIR
jgi:hypothetical protein